VQLQIANSLIGLGRLHNIHPIRYQHILNTNEQEICIKFLVFSCFANPYIPLERKQVTRGFIFAFIYIELSQIYKSIFKLNINYSNSHIVQDERKQISCESPLAWRRLDAAWMQLCLLLKISRNIGIS
jgi:hypothetical protein